MIERRNSAKKSLTQDQRTRRSDSELRKRGQKWKNSVAMISVRPA